VRITVRVSPGARRSQLLGVVDGAVRIRLAARPVDGAANDELVAFLAAASGIRRSAIRIVRGRASRTKVVQIVGVDSPPTGLSA
jgi:uncharacterized protein (TIGR00251 family)